MIFGDGKWKIDLFKRILSVKKGDFIDIGVNVGQTLLNINSIDINSGYIGFEPNSNCVFMLIIWLKGIISGTAT